MPLVMENDARRVAVERLSNADIPKDELSRSLAALPDQYATGNWNGYDEKPLNKDSHRHAKA